MIQSIASSPTRAVAASIIASVAVAACGGDAEPRTTEGAPETEEHGIAKEVSFTQNAFGVTFTNHDGAWTVYTGCFGPQKRGGANLTVGPGYIARVKLKKATPAGHTIIDDEGPLRTPEGHLIGFTRAGHAALGGFAWHHARGQAPFDFTFNNAWEIAGRVCGEDSGGFGVSGATVVDGPRLTPGGAAALAVDVHFSDPWTLPAPIVTVRYVYRVYDSVVKSWALVTEHCANGNCGVGAPGPAYIGEPKFVSAVSGGGYRRMVIFNDQGKIASNSHSTTAKCMWTGAQPTKSTGQCDGDNRVRARFDYGTLTTGTDGKCDATTNLCLNTVMQAYPVDADGNLRLSHAAKLWENPSTGMNRWALLSQSRQAVNADDSPAGGALWSCHGGATVSETIRRWELVGLTKNAAGRYTAAAFYFHAWESGTGAYDCEPLSRRFGPEGEAFAVHAEYSMNDGWSVP